MWKCYQTMHSNASTGCRPRGQLRPRRSGRPPAGVGGPGPRSDTDAYGETREFLNRHRIVTWLAAAALSPAMAAAAFAQKTREPDCAGFRAQSDAASDGGKSRCAARITLE